MIDADTQQKIQTLIETERLPMSFSSVVSEIYLPVCARLHQQYESNSGTHIIGINGCPGSGKSTMALFIKALLELEFNRAVETLSIDDFYKTKQERLELAHTIHPMLITRGVPGTHDIELATHTISALKIAGEHTACQIPRFDKASDDRHPSKHWETVTKAPDFIILEGWCVAATPQATSVLQEPVNSLEQEQDADGVWRQFVNKQLIDHYHDLFDQIEHLIVLQPPSPDIVLTWRIEQETKLREFVKASAGKALTTTKVGMSNEQLVNFVMHYERLIRHMHQSLPNLANTLINLDENRTVTGVVTGP